MINLSKRLSERVAEFFTDDRVQFIARWSPALTIVGTVGLAIVSIDDIRAQVRDWFGASVWQWGTANKVWIVVVLAALTVVPGLLVNFLNRRAQFFRETRKNLELTTAAMSHSSRVAHLITKAGDVGRGEVDEKYMGHTLIEACGYFRSRAVHANGADASERVEACIMRAHWTGNGRDFFERSRQTHTNSAEFANKLSSHRNEDAASVIRAIDGSGYFYANSEGELAKFRRAFKISPELDNFKCYLVVPLVTDRKAVGQARIWGALVLMATAPSMMRETDVRLLETYGWFISAARALNSLKIPAASVHEE